MVVYVSVAILTLIIAYFVNNQYTAVQGIPSRGQMVSMTCMGAIFVILFGISAGRIAVGNDYWGYVEIFDLIDQNRAVSTEWGFNAVVSLVQAVFGAEKYLIIFGVFSFLTVLFFLRGIYDQAEDFFFSFFLFITGAYYYQSLNSVRYYFVLAIALYAMKYALKKEYGRFILWILAAAFFHKSVLVVIPLYYLANRALKKRDMYILVGLCGTFLLFQNVYREVIFFFYPFYENSMFDNGTTSLTNIARCGGVLVLCLLYYGKAIKGNQKNTFYFNLNLGALLLYTFCSFIPEISRIGFYLNVTNIFLIPSVIHKIEKKSQRTLFAIMVIAAFVLYFIMFLRGASDVSIRIVPYRNWIFN